MGLTGESNQCCAHFSPRTKLNEFPQTSRMIVSSNFSLNVSSDRISTTLWIPPVNLSSLSLRCYKQASSSGSLQPHSPFLHTHVPFSPVAGFQLDLEGCCEQTLNFFILRPSFESLTAFRPPLLSHLAFFTFFVLE